jgi:hypothetical protein
MKKQVILYALLCVIGLKVTGQTKTDLSLKVSSAAAANRAQLAGYVWTRTVQVFIEGTLKNTVTSSLSIGPDGKIVVSAVSSISPDPPPTKGIRGKIAKGKIDDLKDYVEEAVKLSVGYLYMSKGKMVDYFDAANITQSGNTITVQGKSVNKPNDNATINLIAGTLAFISQSFQSTLANGDAVDGTFNYKTFSNGLTAFDSGELDLPAKKMKLRISNTNYAKKLQ